MIFLGAKKSGVWLGKSGGLLVLEQRKVCRSSYSYGAREHSGRATCDVLNQNHSRSYDIGTVLW